MMGTCVARGWYWVAVFALLGSGCGDDSGGGDRVTLTLGALVPLTGSAADSNWGTAVDLAAAHANAGLQMEPLKNIALDFQLRDDQGTPDVALGRAVELAQTDGAIGIITGTTAVSQAIIGTHYDDDASNDLGAVLMGCSATSDSLNDPNATNADPVIQASRRDADNWFFRTIMKGELVTKVMIRALLEDNDGDADGDGVFRLGIYATDDPFGNAVAAGLAQAGMDLSTLPFETEVIRHPRDLGGETADTYDWASDVARVVDDTNEDAGTMGTAVDAVVPSVLGSFNVPFARAFAASGATMRVFYLWSFRINSVIEQLGADAEGAEGVSHAILNGESGQILDQALMDEIGTGAVYRSSIYYDGAFALALAAMIKANEMDDPSLMTGADLRDGLTRISDPAGVRIVAGPEGIAAASRAIQDGMAINYDGSSGPVDFDAVGDVLQNLESFRVENGAYVTTGTFLCVESPDCALQ